MCEGNRRIKGAIRSVPATLTEIAKSRKRGPEGPEKPETGYGDNKLQKPTQHCKSTIL